MQIIHSMYIVYLFHNWFLQHLLESFLRFPNKIWRPCFAPFFIIMIIIISFCNTWRCPQRFSETIGSSDLGVWHDDKSMFLVVRKDCLHWDLFRYILRGLNSYRVYHRILWGFFFFMKLFLVRLLWNFIGIVFGMCTCAFRVWHFQNDRRCHDNHESSKHFFIRL
jgi:hypothetical protein